VKAYADMFGYDGARVLWISESIEGRGPMPEMAMMKASDGMVAAAPPPVQPGMVSTGIAMSFKFELVNNAAQ
jgi:uncharacterized protein YggE